MTHRDDICAEARRWLGTPWHHRQRVHGAGVDCAQFLIAVYESCGLLQPGQVEPGDYPPDWHLHRAEERFLSGVLDVCEPTETPRPGDVTLFAYGRCASHGAIVLPAGEIIHSYRRDGGVVISNLGASAELSERLIGYYAPRGLA